MQSVDAIREAVVVPINEILNDTVHAIESYIGHDPDVTRRLRTILAHARQIKKTIHQVGENIAPVAAVAHCAQTDMRPILKERSILVIDADVNVRKSADQLLGKYGCNVETAHEGEEALMMVRNCGFDNGYVDDGSQLRIRQRLRCDHRRHSLARYRRLRFVDETKSDHQ